jgi:hypothetical protein
MKHFSFGAIVILLLFGTNSLSQTTIKEQLKTVEQSVTSSKSDIYIFTVEKLNSVSIYDSIGLKACQCLDSLIAFVATQKQMAGATFDLNVKPYLEKKLLERNMETLDFTDEEDLIYESFINVLNYNNAIITVQLYEDFIVKNYKNQVLMSNILTVLSYIKHTCFYLSKEFSDLPFILTIHCFREDLLSYNVLNWKVFAIHPGAMLIWSIAACAWDAKFEK